MTVIITIGALIFCAVMAWIIVANINTYLVRKKLDETCKEKH